MAETLVASGGAMSLSGLSGYESRFAEGDNGRLEVGLRTSLSSAVLSGIEATIRKAGVYLTSAIRCVGNVLHINFQKRIGALAIIAAAVAAAIVIVALVVSWKLFKLSPMQVVGVATIWLGLIAVAVVVVVLYLQKKG